MTKELMDKYKNGELDNGNYYVKDSQDRISILYMLFGMKLQYEDVVDILAPVPSYEDWQKLQQEITYCNNYNMQIILDNNKLEKQLEIARDTLNSIYETTDANAKTIENCFKQIEELDK